MACILLQHNKNNLQIGMYLCQQNIFNIFLLFFSSIKRLANFQIVLFLTLKRAKLPEYGFDLNRQTQSNNLIIINMNQRCEWFSI